LAKSVVDLPNEGTPTVSKNCVIAPVPVGCGAVANDGAGTIKTTASIRQVSERKNFIGIV